VPEDSGLHALEGFFVGLAHSDAARQLGVPGAVVGVWRLLNHHGERAAHQFSESMPD
jgi:hypothetical protein